MSANNPVEREVEAAGVEADATTRTGSPTEIEADAVAMAAMADEVRQANERVLRAQAELENFRKRMRRDLDEQLRYASLPLLRDLLPVVDNLERALEAAGSQQNLQGMLEGVKMVVNQLVGVFQQHHCRRIEAAGLPFDPNLHEAIAQEASTTVSAGHVTRVTQMGYQLHDRVIRPSQVMVSTGAVESPVSDAGQSA